MLAYFKENTQKGGAFMLILLGIFVFIFGLVVISFGASSHSTTEYALLYLSSVITVCMGFLVRTIKTHTAAQTKDQDKKEASWVDFLDNVNDSSEESSCVSSKKE